eukprot:40936-Amphidinium_carterae.1
MAQNQAKTPTIPPNKVISVASSTVGPNTQDTPNYQQQVENYTGPSLITAVLVPIMKALDVINGRVADRLE